MIEQIENDSDIQTMPSIAKQSYASTTERVVRKMCVNTPPVYVYMFQESSSWKVLVGHGYRSNGNV